VARRVDHQPVVAGGDQVAAGAWLAAGCAGWQAWGVGAGRGDLQGTAGQRAMVPSVPAVLRSRLQTRLGLARRPARPAWCCRAAARRRLGGCHAQPGRHGVCQRGAAQRPGPRPTGPRCPEAWAAPRVTWHRHALEAVLPHVSRALATAGIWAAQGGGSVAATNRVPCHDRSCVIGQGLAYDGA
jgi:hypothetical protein